VYPWVRRAMWLASDNSWTRRRLKHLSWRSWWIILCTLEWGMPVSCEISPADWCLFGLTSWQHYVSNAVCHCLVAGQLYQSCGFSSADRRRFQHSMFPTIVDKFTQQPSALYPFDRFIIKIAASCEMFMILFNFFLIFRSPQFPKVK